MNALYKGGNRKDASGSYRDIQCVSKIVGERKIVDLPLQSYNRKLGHKIGRFTIKSEAMAALR